MPGAFCCPLGVSGEAAELEALPAMGWRGQKRGCPIPAGKQSTAHHPLSAPHVHPGRQGQIQGHPGDPRRCLHCPEPAQLLAEDAQGRWQGGGAGTP